VLVYHGNKYLEIFN
jgi:hypothetical protein